jgi:hypothetical protein
MASSRAAGVQHCPASAASALPQHPPEPAAAVLSVVVSVLPQQPLAEGGVNASAGSPTKPPGRVSVLMIGLLEFPLWSGEAPE